MEFIFIQSDNINGIRDKGFDKYYDSRHLFYDTVLMHSYPLRPYIDSEINHVSLFITTPVIKGKSKGGEECVKDERS